MLADTLRNLGIEIEIVLWVAGIAVALLFVSMILRAVRKR